MHILSPANSPEETGAVIKAGAREIYCGVMPPGWKRKYSNVASPNRREWEVSNMRSFETLAESVQVAGQSGVPVFLALNALYTEEQYPALREFISSAMQSGVAAIIVADLGLLIQLRELGWEREIHVSTGGTSFNDETVRFYRELGASRVILPRQNRISEIAEIARNADGIEIETFILNRGCKNIDGFCTFHHGVNEVRIPLWWRIPKLLHLDYVLLNALKRLPSPMRQKLGRTSLFGSVGACFLAYDIDLEDDAETAAAATVKRNLERNFNVFTGFDTCGACALWDMHQAGITSLKIVGRSNPLQKKLRDVRFLRECLDSPLINAGDRTAFTAFAREAYARHYGFRCENWCYFPESDYSIGAEEL